MPVPYTTIQEAILSVARKRALCTGYHDVLLAGSMDQLIEAGQSNFSWSYRAKIIDATILNMFDPADLENHGIYYSLTGAITPTPTIPYTYYDGIEIWIIDSTSITFTLSGNGKYKINIFNSTVDIVCTNNVYLNIEAYNASGTITVSDDVTVNLELQNTNGEVFNIETNDNAVIHVDNKTKSVLNITFRDNAFARLNGLGRSICNVNLAEQDLDILIPIITEDSIVNYTLAP